jgi:hypothetical protein
MSPAKKKSAPKRTKKAARSGKRAASASAKKAKPAAKKAPAKGSPRKKGSAKAAKPAEPKQAPAAKPAPETKRAPSGSRRTRRRSPARATGAASPAPSEGRDRKPGLGLKWGCFSCGAKFYDLNKPEPICPKCGTDQRQRPKELAAEPPVQPVKRAAMAPMTRFLDEEEPAAEFTEEEEDTASELDLDTLDNGAYLEAVEDEEPEEEE